jgi:hypothetical protein
LRHPLDLYLRIRHDYPEFPASEARAAARHALTVSRWQQSARLELIAAAVAGNKLPSVIDGLTPPEQETAQYLGLLSSRDPAWPLRLLEIVQASNPPAFAKEKPSQPDQGDTGCFSSPWAGVFLLLPALIANRELMAAYGNTEDGALRYLLLGACLRTKAAGDEFATALALAAGLDAAPESWLLQQARPRTNLAGDHALLPDTLLPDDLDHIKPVSESAWPGSNLEPPVRRELQLAAAVLLRGFARRLPGLGRSSFGYLWLNILSGEGMITAAPGRILVTLAPRPLEIVLRMAGLHELSLVLPWKPETEVVVHFDR